MEGREFKCYLFYFGKAFGCCKGGISKHRGWEFFVFCSLTEKMSINKIIHSYFTCLSLQNIACASG